MNIRKNAPFATSFFCFVLTVFVVGFAFLLDPARALAQGTRRDAFGVDIVNLKNHQQYRGVVLNPDGFDDVQIAVSQEWLKKNDKGLYSKLAQQAVQQEDAANEQLLKRLSLWQSENKNPALDFFMERELVRIRKRNEVPNGANADVSAGKFYVITLKRASIANSIMASPVAKNIATWGWNEGLEKVETRNVQDLVRELDDKKVDVQQPAPDLSSRFPATQEDDEHWTSRLALVTYSLGEPIDFQGTGDVMIQVGTDKKPDLSGIAEQMLQSQVTSLLAELSGTNRSIQSTSTNRDELPWIKTASKKAESIHASYFRATHIHMEMTGETALVESVFMAKMPSGKWNVVWHGSADAMASEQPDSAVERIKKDPQISSLAGQLGANEAMDKAIRYGAATMSAQQKVNDQFSRFISRFTNRLDQPKLQ